MQVLPERFTDEPGKTMEDYLAAMREEEKAYERANERTAKSE